MKQKDFFIGIPTINRADLLNEALKKYEVDFPDIDIYIIDNGDQSIVQPDNVFIHKTNSNYGVARSWNKLLISGFTSAKRHKYGLILNDDIYLGKSANEVSDIINEFDTADFICSTKHWCSFICSKDLFFKLDGFDETFFPAYFEDNDFAYRMKLTGAKRINTSKLDPIVYRNSQTIAKDPSLNQGFQSNRNYYIQKWGGAPEQETYLTPFNKK